MPGLNIRDRFESWITFNLATMCWIWSGGKNRDGYGTFHAGKNKKAYKVAYELYVGPVPKGMSVLHKCDVRACVNPEHLYLGTHQDNMRDMKEKGRGNGPRGEDAHTCKLTKDKVLEIRNDKRASKLIAKKYGVSHSLVCRIRRREAWAWL